MKSTFILAVMVGVCFWSTLGRSMVLDEPTVSVEPDECIDLARVAANTIKGKYNLPDIDVRIGVEDLCDQIKNIDSKINFLASVSKAMDSFLTDASDVESPLALAIDLAFDDLGINHSYPVPANVMVHAQGLLIDHLNRSTASVTLLARGESPEYGESVEKNWIFLLQARDLSDHSFWSIVDRSGKNAVYNYGFN